MKNLPPISERYTSTLRKVLKLKTNEVPFLPEIFTNDNSKQRLEKILNEHKILNTSKLICIVPSSKRFTKTYPAEYYVELINKFVHDSTSRWTRGDKQEYRFVLVGKGEDKKNIGVIKSLTGPNVYDLCDKTSLLELTELMKKCSLVITGDTGPMHIAEAVNVPIIMLAGSSVREFGFYPKASPTLSKGEELNKGRNVVLEVNGLRCRPCSHIGRSSCPKGHFKCMKDITPEMVYEAAIRDKLI